MKQRFQERIAAMNAMYRLASHDNPTIPLDVVDRLLKFKITLLDWILQEFFVFFIN